MDGYATSTSSDLSNPLRWHLVFTKPSGEQTAVANIERQGYGVYFPRVKQRILTRGRWRERIGALFPRYLFVQLDSRRQSLAPLRSTLGVANVVRFGNDYITVPPAVVAGLIHRQDSDGLHSLSQGPALRCGAVVRVLEGALAGLEGIFEREEANDRIVVLLDLLGREARIKLPFAYVAPSYAF